MKQSAQNTNQIEREFVRRPVRPTLPKGDYFEAKNRAGLPNLGSLKEDGGDGGEGRDGGVGGGLRARKINSNPAGSTRKRRKQSSTFKRIDKSQDRVEEIKKEELSKVSRRANSNKLVSRRPKSKKKSQEAGRGKRGRGTQNASIFENTSNFKDINDLLNNTKSLLAQVEKGIAGDADQKSKKRPTRSRSKQKIERVNRANNEETEDLEVISVAKEQAKTKSRRRNMVVSKTKKKMTQESEESTSPTKRTPNPFNTTSNRSEKRDIAKFNNYTQRSDSEESRQIKETENSIDSLIYENELVNMNEMQEPTFQDRKLIKEAPKKRKKARPKPQRRKSKLNRSRSENPRRHHNYRFRDSKGLRIEDSEILNQEVANHSTVRSRKDRNYKSFREGFSTNTRESEIEFFEGQNPKPRRPPSNSMTPLEMRRKPHTGDNTTSVAKRGDNEVTGGQVRNQRAKKKRNILTLHNTLRPTKVGSYDRRQASQRQREIDRASFIGDPRMRPGEQLSTPQGKGRRLQFGQIDLAPINPKNGIPAGAGELFQADPSATKDLDVIQKMNRWIHQKTNSKKNGNMKVAEAGKGIRRNVSRSLLERSKAYCTYIKKSKPFFSFSLNLKNLNFL